MDLQIVGCDVWVSISTLSQETLLNGKFCVQSNFVLHLVAVGESGGRVTWNIFQNFADFNDLNFEIENLNSLKLVWIN